MKNVSPSVSYPLVPAIAGIPVSMVACDDLLVLPVLCSIDGQLPVGGDDLFHDDDFCFHNAGTCPECGGGMIRSGACFSCPVCGFGSCGG
ncbi:MAG TPA: hypothetical protein VMS71_02720 [Candidatus Acidoferrum sp.]|nr:hypothetical protein [Candidatus Acidoferrum sp.]